MDRVLLIDDEGRLYYVEPPDENVHALVDKNTTNKYTSINRISCCEWCFWAINSDFQVSAFVYNKLGRIEAFEITYENQKRLPGLTNYAKPIDTFEFSSQDFSLDLPKESFLLPSEHWSWENEWYTNEKTEDGWAYSVSFNKKFRDKPFWYACVRRRRWARKRIFLSYDTFIPIEIPSEIEFANDISIGGWLMPNNAIKGFLCVWIVSNNGNIFFRENVSYENPEGTSWHEVCTPDGLRAFSISCSQDGAVWVITCEGTILFRDGVWCNEPWGSEWLIVDQHPNTRFTQIKSNLNLVYGLDMIGDVYLLSEDKWIKVLKDLSSISISMSNKIWALSKDRKRIFIGTKIHDQTRANCLVWRCIYSPILLDKICAYVACDYFDDLTNLVLLNNLEN